ncbi:MAG: hypothetical protein M3Z64_01580 [Verrucomicrobiota bacterium]|nr:hypothetical protein [Verrucomicrobiota bacterium]
MITLQYPNSDVQDVLHLYETLTGKRLVMDNFVAGKVNIFIAKPVARDEAVKILEMSLLLNGYSLIPAGGDIMKVVFAQSKNPRSVGIPIISDEADLPDNRIVSYLFKLRYADPVELQQVLGQYLSPPQSYTSFLALPKASAILITENSAVIRTLIHIVEQIDTPPAEVQSEFIKLQRADAQKVVDLVNDVLDLKSPSTPGAPGQPGAPPVIRPVRANVPGAPGQVQGDLDVNGVPILGEGAVVVGKVKITADVRTNRIHVITRPINMPTIRKLIAQFDENVDFAKPVTRALRYISAADILPVLVQALTEPGTGQGGGTSEPTNNPNLNAQQQAQQRRATGTSNSASTAGDFGGSSGGGGGSGLNVSEELSTQAVDTTPKAVTVGNAKIIADQRANSIIVLGNREVVVKVGKILDEMDVSSPQVALSTVIGELTLNNSEEFGVDYFSRFNHGNPFSGAANSRNTSTSFPPADRATSGGLLDPAQLLNFQQLASVAAGGANVYLAAGNTLSAIVKALDSTGKFKTISRPTVFTTNNKKAIIASGQEIPVPVNTVSSAVGGNLIGNGIAQQSNIQFKKIALQLEVVPLINSEKEVSLDILQKLDSRGADVQISGNPIPTIQTRYIKTTVTAPNCSTIVLGGLIQDSNQRGQSGIPVLSRIPVIGGLFRDTNKSKSRTELIVLMRPEVTLTKLDLVRLRAKQEEKTHFGPELDQDDCPDCPKPTDDGKDVILPAPDLPKTR